MRRDGNRLEAVKGEHQLGSERGGQARLLLERSAASYCGRVWPSVVGETHYNRIG